MPFDLVTYYWSASDLLSDELGQRHFRVQAVEFQAVQRCHRTQFGIAFEHEVAKEAQVKAALWRLAEQFAQGRQVVLVADHAEHVTHFQHGAARGVQQLLAPEQRGDPRAFGHFQLAQRGADAPFFGAQAVDEQFPLAG